MIPQTVWQRPLQWQAVWTEGLVATGCDWLGDPAVLRWMAIESDGQLARHTTRNQMGLHPGVNRWVQGPLVRAVRIVVAPPDTDWDRRAQVFNLHTAGVVIAASPCPGDSRPCNPVAAAMVTAINPQVTSLWALRGPVAWLGPVSLLIGPHASLTDEQITTLEQLARTRQYRGALR